jgi:hypothetical protein
MTGPLPATFSRFGPWLTACTMLLGLGCGRISFETVWTVDGGPVPAVDAAAPDTATAPVDGPFTDGPSPRADGPPPPIDAPPPADVAANPASAITLDGQVESARVGSTGAGMPYRDLCPPGEVVIGYQGTQGRSPTMPWLQAIQAQCGSLAVGPGPGYAITTAPGTWLPLRGMSGGVSWSRPCPSSQVVVGFEGRSSGYVDQLALRCAPLTITGGPGSHVVSRGLITTTAPTDSNSGSPFAPIDCPAGQIAVGSNVTADNYPRSFGLFCATPSISPP